MKRVCVAATLAACLTGPAMAQSLTVEDLRRQVDERVSERDSFQSLLSDPDPARSIAAMQIMMSSGDPDLMRMAREYGLYADAPQVRRAALDAYFSSGPVLEIWYDASGLEDSQRGKLESEANYYSGSLAEGQRVFYSFKVGDYSEENSCWMLHNDSYNRCLVRLSEDSVSVRLFDVWASLALDEAATLTGMAKHGSHHLPVSIRVTQ
ncbi:MAG: hypothetical protein AAGE18_19225 [Pseudomonadota bacterium]